MATCIAKCMILAILYVALGPSIFIQGQHVPCYYVFGDGLSDDGNSNNLNTFVQANYLPYGIDYSYGVTGRFSNGNNFPDYFVQRLGFFKPIPPYTTAQGTSASLIGLNYASGGSGILDETSYQLGDRIWMDRQLSNHQGTINQINTLLGNQTATNNLLRKCLYTITLGNNDYITNYYFKPPPTLSALFDTPEKFSEKLIQKYSQQLTTLYNLQARKVAVFGVFPIGCLPNTISMYPTNGAPCVEKVNDGVRLFNNKLISLISHLNANLSGAQFTYINSFDIASGNFSFLGIKVQSASCCEVSLLTYGLCVRNGHVCSNRNEYAYFDNYHPTQLLYNYIASRAYNAQSSSDASPFDIATLVQN